MALEKLFLDYFFEEYGRETIVNEHGFISYSFHGTDECLIGEIYIRPESRKSLEVKKLFSQVEGIAKSKGYKYITGIVAIGEDRAEKSTKILRTYFAYGFKLYGSANGHALVRLDIGEE